MPRAFTNVRDLCVSGCGRETTVRGIFFFPNKASLSGKYVMDGGIAVLDRESGRPEMHLSLTVVCQGTLDGAGDVVLKVVGSRHDVAAFTGLPKRAAYRRLGEIYDVPSPVENGFVTTAALERRGVTLEGPEVRDVEHLPCVIMTQLRGQSVSAALTAAESEPSVYQSLADVRRVGLCDFEHYLWLKDYADVEQDSALSINDRDVVDFHNRPAHAHCDAIAIWRWYMSVVVDVQTGTPTALGRCDAVVDAVASVLCIPTSDNVVDQSSYFPYKDTDARVLPTSQREEAIAKLEATARSQTPPVLRLLAAANVFRLMEPFFAWANANQVVANDMKSDNCVVDLCRGPAASTA